MPVASGNQSLHPSWRNDNVIIVQHVAPEEFLHAAMPSLLTKEHSPIIILAHTLKGLNIADVDMASASQKFACSNYSPSTSSEPIRCPTFWLTVWSGASLDQPPVLDLVLMCASWTLGDYPIFLWTPHGDDWASSSLSEVMTVLVAYLAQCVQDNDRVFAVFGQANVTESFAVWWSRAVGVPRLTQPFYDAYLSQCTMASLKDGSPPLPVGHFIRPAKWDDLIVVSNLCQGFAEDSVVYPLDKENAQIEARALIEAKEVWVYEADGVVTSLCAATRRAARAIVISKVFTDERERGKGYAERLVRFVTKTLLFDYKKEFVVLYVGKNNRAKRVYGKIGFIGLERDARPEGDGCEHWLELGFATKKRGHW